MASKFAFESAYINSAEKARDFIRSFYDLEVQQKTPVYTLAEMSGLTEKTSNISHFFVVCTDSKKYLIKEQTLNLAEKKRRGGEIIPYLQEHLLTSGCKVSHPPYLSKDNKHYVNLNGHFVEVIDYTHNVRNSNNLEYRAQDIMQFAKELAKIHKATKTFDSELISSYVNECDRFKNARFNPDENKSFLEELGDHERIFQQKANDKNLSITARENYKAILDLGILKILREDYGFAENTKNQSSLSQIIHRDPQTGNVLFDINSGELIALSDWDGCGFFPVAYDLLYAADGFSIDRNHFFNEPNADFVKLFLNTYLKENALAIPEIKEGFGALRSDMIDRTAIFLRSAFLDEDTRSNVAAAHTSLLWRLRKLEKMISDL